jgi:hypothetical protein
MFVLVQQKKYHTTYSEKAPTRWKPPTETKNKQEIPSIAILSGASYECSLLTSAGPIFQS